MEMQFQSNEQREEVLNRARAFSRDGYVDVRTLLVFLQIRQNDIAKKYGLGKAEVNKVVNRKRSTLYIRKLIAQELDVPFSELWGAPNAS